MGVRLWGIFVSIVTLALTTSMTRADQGVINSLPNGLWCTGHQLKTFGTRCASGAGGMCSVRMFVFGATLEINMDCHNGAFSDYKANLKGLNLSGRMTDRNTTAGYNCPNILGFTGAISPDGRKITISQQTYIGARGCTVTKWGPDYTMTFVRIR